MFQHESFFFVGVIVCIFLFWLVTGGPTHPISRPSLPGRRKEGMAGFVVVRTRSPHAERIS